MVGNLRPGYKPPTRKAVGGTLLETVVKESQDFVKKELRGKICTLVDDGWSNIHNDPVTATCFHIPGK